MSGLDRVCGGRTERLVWLGVTASSCVVVTDEFWAVMNRKQKKVTHAMTVWFITNVNKCKQM